jgi:hypothetical protein
MMQSGAGPYKGDDGNYVTVNTAQNVRLMNGLGLFVPNRYWCEVEYNYYKDTYRVRSFSMKHS